jgi:integrase
VPHNRGTRHKPKYVGIASYKGHTKWVGTHSTLAAYKTAEWQRLAELREEVDGASRLRAPTVKEFASAVTEADGRIVMRWPDGQRAQKETGRRDSSVRRLREGLKPFLRDFGERRLDSFTRDEAATWALPQGRHVQQSVRQFFNHALDRELVDCNQFACLGASKRKRRIDRPDFQLTSDEQYKRLLRCARQSRTDDYGLIIEGAILAIGETAMRPGEIFALHRPEIHLDMNMIHVRRQIDLATGNITWPKDDDGRWIAMSPTLREHLERMPRIGKVINPSMGEIVYPAPRGGYMRRSTWSTHWHSVRASAGMPGQDFCELKHRAIQWMIDPIDDDGLGLDFQTVAQMAGHDDGGYLIATVYTKLTERRALARTQRAMNAYQHPSVTSNGEPCSPSRCNSSTKELSGGLQ